MAGAALAVGFGIAAFTGAETSQPAFKRATNSSPITLSADNELLWSVNHVDDSVSVIDANLNTVLARVKVGDEPQSVALDPGNKFAYVANAADNSVTVIRIVNANPQAFHAEKDKTLKTGAEPWNIVVSPDGRRVFVANSGQDTITVINAHTNKIIGDVDLRNSLCNDPDRERRFQPRGLAVTLDSNQLYVTRFISFTKEGGKQGDDEGREGLVCRLDIDTHSDHIGDYKPAAAITLAAQVTGFTVDSDIDGDQDDTSAFSNQLQSIVIRGNSAYLPNIAASPEGPQIFNVTNQSFVNRIDGINGDTQSDAGALNLNLGARDPEPGKVKLFFPNPWGIAFTTQSGEGAAYIVSAASDLLVKTEVGADGALALTVDADTTRYIDLNDPDNPATSGDNAGKNPQGVVANDLGTKAYVVNFVSGNISVVDLVTDTVAQVIRTTDLQPPGSPGEVVAVGAEMFFSSRGNFDQLPGLTVSTRNRLAQEGWQACSTCHFEGWTDGVIWAFGTGARKSVPLNASFNPHNPTEQRVLNYSAIFDELEDFEGNIRNTSGPGPGPSVPCDDGSQMSTFRPTHGLLLGTGNINNPPCAVPQFIPPNADRPQLTVTLPGSNVAVPALTALREWVRLAIRTPNAPLTEVQLKGKRGASLAEVILGRVFFKLAGCADCHGGQLWTSSIKDFTSPPAKSEICTEVANVDPAFCDGDGPTPAPQFGNPVGNQYLARFLRDIKTFNIGVEGGPNPFGNNIGAVEKSGPAGVVVAAQDGLGIDYNGDGKGNGFSPSSLLGIGLLPPYLHNGACETIACILSDPNHRNAGGGIFGDFLDDPELQKFIVRFVESIDDNTRPIN